VCRTIGTITVKDGWIALAGTLDWQYQKDAADRAVRDLTGVKGVTNGIRVQSPVKTLDVRNHIEAAFKRSAEIDARRINVTAHDGTGIISAGAGARARTRRDDGERLMIQIQRILCPIDFSPVSSAALEHAAALAQSGGGPVGGGAHARAEARNVEAVLRCHLVDGFFL
jgi:hypothetical protein